LFFGESDHINQLWAEPKTMAKKVVIITGGSSGIGLALAHQYVSRGEHVVLIARRQDLLVEAKAELEKSLISKEQEIISISCDVSVEEQLKPEIQKVVDHFGRVDVLITSAGYSKPGYFSNLSTLQFKETFDTNFYGTLYAVQAVVPTMKEKKSGQIIFIASGAALIGIFGTSAYCASKFAIKGFAEVLRAELVHEGIRVSVACPPDTYTPQLINNEAIKPSETKMIMGSGGCFSAETVAKSIYDGAKKGRFVITKGASLYFLHKFGSLLLPLVNWYFDRVIRLNKKKSNKESS